jgi:hypothetical protein
MTRSSSGGPVLLQANRLASSAGIDDSQECDVPLSKACHSQPAANFTACAMVADGLASGLQAHLPLADGAVSLEVHNDSLWQQERCPSANIACRLVHRPRDAATLA